MADYEVFSYRYTSPSSFLTNSEFGELQYLVKYNRFRLCNRKSRDGIDVSSFHDRCDFMKNTIALGKSEHGYVFGGYNQLDCRSRYAYVSDVGNDNFIFTLKNPYKTKLIFRQNNDGIYAIYDHASYGPTFGQGLYFSGSSDRNSYMNANSYRTNPLEISQGKYMAGSNDKNFYVHSFDHQDNNWRHFRKFHQFSLEFK